MDLLDAVKRYRIVTAVRGVPSERMVDTAKALYEGGIRMLEITFNQSDPEHCGRTKEAIESVRNALGKEMLIGAGTVMSVGDVDAAAEAGAQYLLSPNLNLEVLRYAKSLGLGMIPGAMSPSEVAAAYENGADLVKLFPCDVLGMGYIRALRAPISHVPLLAMGGVNADNLTEYLSLVEGVGIGSAITNKEMILKGDYAGLTGLARKYTSKL